MSRKHQLPSDQKRDSKGSGLLRARMLEVDKFNANQAFYASLGDARAIKGHPRTSRYAKDRDRPDLTPKQEAARLRVSWKVILRRQPRRNRLVFRAAHEERLQRLANASPAQF